MFIYIVVILGLFVTAIKDMIWPMTSETRNKVFWFWVVVLILFKGLRWDTGTDWSQYCATFYRAEWGNIFRFYRYGFGTTLMEPLYVFMNVLVKTFLPHYTFFLLATNAFILIVFGKFMQKYVNRGQLIALATFLVATEFFPVRQTLTFPILCIAYKYIIDRNLKLFTVCMVINFFIHRSSLIMFPLYWVLGTEFKLKRSYIIYIACLVGSEIFYRLFSAFNTSEFLISITGGITETYDATHDAMQAQQEGVTWLDKLFTFANTGLQLYLFNYAFMRLKMVIKNPEIVHMYNLCINVYLVLICLNAIALNPGFGSLYRITNAFWTIYPICVAFTVVYFLNSNKYLLALCIFMALFAIKLQSQSIMHPENEGFELFVPYKSFLQEDESVRSGSWIF